MTKKAMLELYKEGIIPHIQIHDELDISVEDESHAKKIIEVMENAVTLEVPNKVDYESRETTGVRYMDNLYGLLKCKHSCRICSNKERIFI